MEKPVHIKREHAELEWLRKPLHGWIDRIERFAQTWSGRPGEDRDAAYWHNESATLSVLAAALAERNADVLAEFACQRTRKGVGRGKGRGDLWTQLRRRSAIVEAKQVFLAKPAGLSSRVETKLDEGEEQLRSAEHRELAPGTSMLAIVVVVPRVHHEDFSDSTVKDFRREAAQVKYHASAMSFPQIARNLRGVWPAGADYVFPGVMMFIHEVQRSSR